MTFTPNRSFRAEQDLPPDSLACRQNWPDWAQQLTDDLVGLAALKSLARSERPLHFLGSPFLEDVEVIKPRISSYTGKNGEYVTEQGLAKITTVKSPGAACMRAVINRPGMVSYVPNIDERCFSGYHPSGDDMLTITTLDMARQAQRDPFLRFVAVIDISNVDPADIHENMHDKRLVVDLHRASATALIPDLIVPITARRDLPTDMLIINEPNITRAEARSVFDWLCNNPGTIPSRVSIEGAGRLQHFQVTRLGQLSLTSSAQ